MPQGAGQPEQFDGVGEHADDVVATLVHRCVAPRRVRRGLPTSTAGVKAHDLKTKTEVLKPLDNEMTDRFDHQDS